MSFPAAPTGTFRLFRLLELYPVPKIHLQTFPYAELDSQPGSTYPHDDSAYSGSPLNQCPARYDAISYCWNPNPDEEHGRSSVALTQPMTVVTPNNIGPFTIHVTNHLFYGLLTAAELCSPSWLFVDAICINQMDANDKAAQVQGMDRVFRGASRVLIWLGMEPSMVLPSETEYDVASPSDRALSTSSTDTALVSCLDRIPTLVEVLESYLNDHGHSPARQRIFPDFPGHQDLQSSGLPSEHDLIWSALEQLRTNTWFSRLWIVQEAVLSQESVLLHGNHMLPWPTYVRFTMLCETIITSLFSQQHDNQLVNQLTLAYNARVSALIKLQKYLPSMGGATDGNSVTLMSLLLHNIRKSKATVSVDRVFAVLGLLSEPMRESIRVDYSNDIVENYWLKWVELFRVILYFVPSAAEEMLSLAAFLVRHPNLPSWCPNLADAGESSRISGVVSFTAGMPNGRQWTATDGSSSISLMPELPNIRLLGFEVDQVYDIVDFSWIEAKFGWSQIVMDHDHDDIDSDAASNVLATLWKCLELMKAVTGKAVSDGDAVLARCITANTYDDRAVDSEELTKNYMAFARWLEHHSWGGRFSGQLQSSVRAEALRFGNRFQRMAKKRAFFITKAGRCGLCSSKTRRGDSVCVFMNFRLPYLLRSSGDGRVKLVGECYIDGMMNGEAFKGVRSADKPQVFIMG